MPRVFEHAEGDWKKLDKMIRDILVKANEVDKDTLALAKKYNSLKKDLIDAYHMTPKVDALFYDSPAAPRRILLYWQAYFKKVGFDGFENIFEDPMKTLRFVDQVKDACAWMMKFKDEKKEEEIKA